MKILTLSLVMAVVGIACAQPAAESNNKPEVGATPIVAEKEIPAAKNETECKICEFDFAAYKGELKKEEVEGLLLALNDEYMATAIYQGVNEKFDDPRPFSNIVQAEQRHAKRLIGLFETYKIPVPENPWPGKVPDFATVKAACEAGIQAEIENRDLYARLFKSTNRADILAVYKALQSASEENHKPAFERCASGNGNGGGTGRGMGRGRGRIQ